jgi:N-acetylmuramoyl-L-alanine amidase
VTAGRERMPFASARMSPLGNLTGNGDVDMTQPRRSGAASARPFASRTSAVGAFALAATLLLSVTAVAHAAPLVFIDPGHGGIYNHARNGKVREKDVNLAISLELGRQLQASGYRVAYSRTSDVTVSTLDAPTWAYDYGTGFWRFERDGRRFGDPPLDDLQARVDMANALGADVFISIHNNGARSRRANGTETWASSTDPLGIALGRSIQTSVVRATRLRNRGAKQTGFYVLNWSNMPAALVEGGFISNRREVRLLSNSTFRRKMASGIATGIRNWFASAPVRPFMSRYSAPLAVDLAAAVSARIPSGGAATVFLVPPSFAGDAFVTAPLLHAAGAPVLFADAAGLPPATGAELARLRPTAIVAFGTALALPDSVVASAATAAGTAPTTRRISGADRYVTAALVADEAGVPASGEVVVVSDDSLAGMVTAASVSLITSAPVIVTPAGGAMPPAAAAFLAAHAAEITRTIVLGPESLIPSATLAGLPNQVRVPFAEAFQLNGRALQSARPQGALAPWVVSPGAATDCLVALSGAATSGGGLVLLNDGSRMSPYTREWLENERWHSLAFSIVGGAAVQPVAVEWMIDKGIHR